jgi:hypothetical protein
MSITNDRQYHEISVDIAVLKQDVTIFKSDAYIIQLSPQYVSYASFQAMFYKDITFKAPKTLSESADELVANISRLVKGGPFEDSILDGSFNLFTSLSTIYERDLDIPIECWETCSYIDFKKLILPIKSLTDINGSCTDNIKCSMSLDEFFNSLEVQDLVMDPISGLPLDPSNNPNGRVLYQGVVSANIIQIFNSTTPGVKDLQINWPFLINFNSYKTLPNSNSWPTIHLQNGLNRSDKYLQTNLVDASGVALPNYDRYNAYKYSLI